MQIWLTEGRDYRSLNEMPDRPEKSLWGSTQLEWLKTTLKASDGERQESIYHPVVVDEVTSRSPSGLVTSSTTVNTFLPIA